MNKLQEKNKILKKGYGHIHYEKENHPIPKMREILDISRSTYYQSLNKTISNRERENNKLIKRLITIYQASKQRYDAPREQHLLVKEDYEY